MASRSAEYHKKARLENPEHYREKDKKKYLIRAEQQKSLQKKNRVNDPQSYIFKQVKSRSKRLGLDFNLEKEDIVIPEVCPILLIPLVVGNSKICDNSPSLDRIDNTKGYVKGNVQVISFKANRCKSNLSLDEIRRMYEYTCRYKQKGGVQDLKKVIHYAELLISQLEKDNPQ